MNNRQKQFERAIRFRDAAVADGWDIEPTYKSEPQDRAAKLRKDGYIMSILTRHNPGNRPGLEYEGSIHIWGPDELCITPPQEYDWQAIIRGVSTCDNCGAKDIEPHRYSFAGRCCGACLPEMRRKHEYPGWCN